MSHLPPEETNTATRAATAETPAFDPEDTPALTAAAVFGAPVVPGIEIVGELGHGGMGVVYRGRQAGLNRDVAVKVVPHENPQAVRRFLAEAAAVAAVDHPNVVRVYEFGEHLGRPYLVMEYVPGGSLADVLAARGRLPQAEAAAVAEDIAAGAAAAHAAGVIHRDIKPGNVLVADPAPRGADRTPAGDATTISALPGSGPGFRSKLSDFGLAKQAGAESLTLSKAVIGTPAYMAPEQARGAKFVSPAADVWSVGVILYECLTGTRPFTGADAYEILDAVRSGSPSRLRTLAPETPRDLAVIADKCLRKDPADRYPTAAELYDDLRRFRAGEAILARPAGRAERAFKWAKRHPSRAAAWLFAGLAGLFAGFGVTVALLYRNADRARGQEVEARQIAEAAKATADDARGREVVARKAAEDAKASETRAKDDAALVRYARTVDLAMRAYTEGDALKAELLLADCPPALRGWEWRFLNRSLTLAAAKFPSAGSRPKPLAFSPDGKLLAVNNNMFRVYDWKTGAAVAEGLPPKPGSAVTVAAFSPDGLRCVAARRGDVAAFVPANGKAAAATAALPTSEAVGIAFTGPDLVRVLTASGQTLDLAADTLKPAGPPRNVFEPGKAPKLTALDPTGKFVAGYLPGPAPRIAVWSLDEDLTVACIWSVPPDAAFEELRLAAGGKAVGVNASGLWRVYRNDASKGSFGGTWSGGNGDAPTFSADARIAVVSGTDRLVRVIDVPRGREIRTYRGQRDPGFGAVLDPSGTWAAAGDTGGTIHVWPVAEPSDAVFLRGPVLTAPYPDQAALTPDGRRVFAVLPDGAVAAYDLVSAAEVFRLETAATGPATAVVIPPGGQWVLTGHAGGGVRGWDPETGALKQVFPADGADNGPAGASPDGRYLLLSGAGGTRIWDLRTNAGAGRVPVAGRGAVSPDGAFVALADRTVSAAHAVADGTKLFEMPAKFRRTTTVNGRIVVVMPLAVRPDGRAVAAGFGDRQVQVYELPSGRPVFANPPRVGILHAVAFSPDGSRLAVAGDRPAVTVLLTATGDELLTLPTPARLSAVAFSADGAVLTARTEYGGSVTWKAGPPPRK